MAPGGRRQSGIGDVLARRQRARVNLDRSGADQTKSGMKRFSGMSFGFGVCAGALAAWVWLGGTFTAGSSGAARSRQFSGGASAGPEALPATPPVTTVEELFPGGPLADAAFWRALRQGGAAREAALRGKVSEILASPRLYARRRWFAAMLENYHPGDLEAIHQGMLDQEESGGRFNKEYEQMMERAAEVEGRVVMDIIQKESGKPGAPVHDWQARCMADWSAVDKAGAVEWWNALPDGTLRDFLAGSLIEGIAGTNPEEAWSAAMMFDPARRANAAPEVVKAFARERGLEGGAEWVASLGPEDAGAKSRALEELADYMHNIDPARQGALVERFAGEEWAGNCPAFRRVARSWASRDGAAAADWAESLPEASRRQALPEVIKRWAGKETGAAGVWLEAQSQAPDFPGLAATFLQQLRNQESPEYQNWSRRLSQLTPDLPPSPAPGRSGE